MTNHPMNRKVRGFSMIEVLIAVVVLGFGLMALAALQTSIIRSSAETKAQTVALQLAKDKVEDLRAFQTLAGYQALTSGNDTATESAVTYARSWTVTRFGYQPSKGTFGPIDKLTDETPAADADGVAYTANNEYKRVAVTVSWTDANGDPQNIGIEDAIGAVSPGDGAKVVLNNTASSEPRYPRVLIRDPILTDGVIPIAVGGGTETAATNPKPEIAGNNNQHVVETRFDVLTYAGLNNGTAQAQSRVETVVVGCTCNAGNAVSTDISYRPTYWNGFRYAAPTAATYTPKSGAATIANNAPPQSQYCNTCCRDHHDPSGVTGPKFDPRRATHAHYKPGGLVIADANDDYVEACRLIRVDGIFRVAADLNNDYFNLIAARNDGTSGAFAPTTAATANYQGIVLGYLNQRIVNQGSSSSYNTPIADMTSLESTWSINSPDTIDMLPADDFKWLHSRGLFIDYLEPEALDKITNAKSSCNTSVSSLQSCVLKYVPFTSINLSELTNWSPTSGVQLVVTNADFADSVSQVDPVRGKVLPGSKPTKGVSLAYSSIFNSNSGIALLADAIDPDETTLTDSQKINIAGGTPPVSGGSYTINVNTYTFGSSASSYPTFSATPSTTCNYATTGGSKPNPFTCTSSSVGVPTVLNVKSYNYSDTSRTSMAAITCSGQNGNVSYTPPAAKDAYTVTYCKNYAVSSVTPSGTIGSPLPLDGSVSEYTPISFSTISDGAAISIGMTFQNETKTANKCTYTVGTCNGNNCDPNVYSITSDPCN